MGAIGGHNPCAFHLGGDPSPTEKIWTTLRKAVGSTVTGRPIAGPVGGLEDSWRLAKAQAIGAVLGLDELAAVQAFPDRATAHLPVWEELLGLTGGGSEQERRDAATAALTVQLLAVLPEIKSALQAIDSGIDVVVQSYASSTTWIPGKSYANRAGDTFNTIGVEAMLSYSCHHVLFVRWSGAPGGVPPATTRATVERYLNTVLPSWVDYSISNASGFYLDGFNNSFLDLTAF
jgi:hypothetical protein